MPISSEIFKMESKNGIDMFVVFGCITPMKDLTDGTVLIKGTFVYLFFNALKKFALQTIDLSKHTEHKGSKNPIFAKSFLVISNCFRISL